MEYHSAIKRNEFKSVLVSGMNLKPVIQSKVSQKDKNKHHILTHLYIYRESRKMVLTGMDTGVRSGWDNLREQY